MRMTSQLDNVRPRSSRVVANGYLRRPFGPAVSRPEVRMRNTVGHMVQAWSRFDASVACPVPGALPARWSCRYALLG